VEEQWVTHVSATAATLAAKVNPGDAATTYRFEYATSEAALLAGGGEVFPAPPTGEGEAGAGGEGVVVEEHPQGLAPGTDYWYRVVATSGEGVTLGCQTEGSCQTFTTRPTGGGSTLPDGRAWELVSPAPGSNGATSSLGPSEEHGGVIQAAEDGGAIAYLGIGATEENPAGYTNLSQVLSERNAGGWSSQDIATPHSVPTGVALSGQEDRFFSSDLSVGLVEPLGSGSTGTRPEGAAALSPGASEKTIYMRADTPLSPDPSEQGVFGEAAAEGGYLPLVTSCPAEGDAELCNPSVENLATREQVPPGTKFGGAVTFKGATADLRNVVLYSSVPLTAKTPEGNTVEGGGLYEWSEGKLQLVSVLPQGEQESSAFLGEVESRNVRGAISSDGLRIVWTSSQEDVFMRDVASERTVELDIPEEGAAGGTSRARFQFANSDGSKVFFTDTAQLTTNSTAQRREPDLYECEMVEEGGEQLCVLSDLTVDPENGGRANVQGVALMGSNDSSHIYFVATGNLTGEEANERGEKAVLEADNMYMLHYSDATKKWEAPVFIAVLSHEDGPDWSGPRNEGGVPGALAEMTSRVSPDGEYIAFMSERSLTGYNNYDVTSAVPDEEVYEYHASSRQLVCASCNPTGERPTGVLDSKIVNEGRGLLVDQLGIWTTESGRWLAGLVPGWTPMEEATARYQSRYLSDEGRLFFDSSDTLVPQATNGLMNVYEYEPASVGGAGGCDASSATFNGRSGGCVGLISSGISDGESVFLDASGKGPGKWESEDVFFLSSAQLVPADTGSGLAVYDAHVCSAAVPCAGEASQPPTCATAASCRLAPALQPSVFGAGPSETFVGTGNEVWPKPAKPVVKHKTKPLTRVQRLAKVLKACRKTPKGARRAGCEKHARERYGASKAKKSTNVRRSAH
jgi:hypothetical protein